MQTLVLGISAARIHRVVIGVVEGNFALNEAFKVFCWSYADCRQAVAHVHSAFDLVLANPLDDKFVEVRVLFPGFLDFGRFQKLVVVAPPLAVDLVVMQHELKHLDQMLGFAGANSQLARHGRDILLVVRETPVQESGFFIRYPILFSPDVILAEDREDQRLGNIGGKQRAFHFGPRDGVVVFIEPAAGGKGNRRLGTREQLAYAEAVNTVKGVRYAATLWASTRRNGEYTGLNLMHLIGVGAARDAHQRSDAWFKGLEAFLKSLKADEGLSLAARTIGQIAESAATSKLAFLDAAQRAGVEVYRAPLSQAPVWAACAGEWGQGPGFKMRVASHLEKWFASKPDLKDKLEEIVNNLWEQAVILPLLRLVEEGAPEVDMSGANIVRFPSRMSA